MDTAGPEATRRVSTWSLLLPRLYAQTSGSSPSRAISAITLEKSKLLGQAVIPESGFDCPNSFFPDFVKASIAFHKSQVPRFCKCTRTYVAVVCNCVLIKGLTFTLTHVVRQGRCCLAKDPTTSFKTDIHCPDLAGDFITFIP